MKHWILINTVEDINSVFNLRNGLLNELNQTWKIDKIVFRPFPFKEEDFFRGFSWMEEITVLEEKQQGLVWICEVPKEKNIESIFLGRLKDRIQEAKAIAQPLQILITCRRKGPLYDFLMIDQDVVFRRNLNSNYIYENPFTGVLQSGKNDLLMAVVNSDEKFSGLDFEVLIQ